MTDHSEKPSRHIGCDDHDACEGGPCKQAEKPWTPDMPIRADATDAQIEQRYRWMQQQDFGRNPFGPKNVVREFASAVSLEKDAEIARLRIDAERLDKLDAMREAEWHAEHRQEDSQPEQVLDNYYWAVAGQCSDVRSAIDSAKETK